MRFIVAIDGTAGSGKGTIGRAISNNYNFKYLDTGLLYRAVAFNLRSFSCDLERISEKNILQAIQAINKNILELKELRENEIGEIASLIATKPSVRANLLVYQRDFANQKGGAVLDGRDIGTVVCPDADVKIFVDAAESVRAQRRFNQFKEQNFETSYNEVLANLRKRDTQDRIRKIAPMVPSKDALLLDSSEISVQESLDIIILRINTELKKITLNS
tara:strand:- start:344 stop:997 length:654 start_codon:yes stop_codon:yes gene_type:complete